MLTTCLPHIPHCSCSQLGIFDISHRSYPRSKTGQQPYGNSPTFIRDWDDAVFHIEMKRALARGSQVIMFAGSEVRDAFHRGSELSARPDLLQDLENVFGSHVIGLPNIIIDADKTSMKVQIGHDHDDYVLYRFQLARLENQPLESSSIILRADSFAAKNHHDLSRSLHQGIAFHLMVDLTGGDINPECETYRSSVMHVNKDGRVALSGIDLRNGVMRLIPRAKRSYDEYLADNAPIASFMMR